MLYYWRAANETSRSQKQIERGNMETTETTRVVVYTTAPDAYDGFSTRTEAEDVGQTCGKQVRRVSMEERDYVWQTSRYASGLHMAIREDSWRGLVSKGLAVENKPAPAAAVDPVAARLAAAAIAMFGAVEQVNGGMWQVPHSAIVDLMQAVQSAGFEF
jgi:hypothetical protein